MIVQNQLEKLLRDVTSRYLYVTYVLTSVQVSPLLNWSFSVNKRITNTI